MATGNVSTTEEATSATAAGAQRVKLPGFGLPLSFGFGNKDIKFPQALELDKRGKLSKGLTRRELRMLDFMDKVTDEPGWERQVYDEKMVDTWRQQSKRETYGKDKDVFLSQTMFENACSIFPSVCDIPCTNPISVSRSFGKRLSGWQRQALLRRSTLR